MTGRFIVFEGGEGSGKTTQVARLAQALNQAGHTVTATREPGGTALGQYLRTLLLTTRAMPAKAEAFLFLADRVTHVEQVIRPALERGDIVVSDRFADSSTVYQGIGRGLGIENLTEMSEWATGGLSPDLVIVLDIDPRVGLARAGQRRGFDRIEREGHGFHDRVRAGFQAVAARRYQRQYLSEDAERVLGSGTRYVLLDADRAADAVAADVLDAVAALLADPCPMVTGADQP